jgi:hypothetical protein
LWPEPSANYLGNSGAYHIPHGGAPQIVKEQAQEMPGGGQLPAPKEIELTETSLDKKTRFVCLVFED